MRLISLKLDKQVAKYLRERVVKEYSFMNPGLVFDIFCLLRRKGAGIPTLEVLEKIIDYFSKGDQKKRVTVSLILKRQRHVLEKIEQSGFFRALTTQPDSIKATRQLISHTLSVLFRLNKAYCGLCRLNAQCTFYREFKDVSDISALAGNYLLLAKVHTDCPRRPALDLEDMITRGTEIMNKLMALHDTKADKTQDSLTNAPSAPPDDYDPDFDDLGNFLGNLNFDPASNLMPYGGAGKQGGIPQYEIDAMLKSWDSLVSQLQGSNSYLYALGLAFEDGFGLELKKDAFKSVEGLGERLRTETTSHYSDLHKVKPADAILPEEVIDRKFAEEDMRIDKYQEQKAKKVHVYVLIDISSSMSGTVTTGITRINLAKSFVHALINRLKRDGAVFIARAFNANVGERIYAETEEEYEYAYDRLVKRLSPNGGTSINRALNVAMKEIVEAKDKISDAEILIITDSEDGFNRTQVEELQKILKKWPSSILHTIQVSHMSPTEAKTTLEKSFKEYGAAPAGIVLKELSKRWSDTEVHRGNINVQKILQAVSL